MYAKRFLIGSGAMVMVTGLLCGCSTNQPINNNLTSTPPQVQGISQVGLYSTESTTPTTAQMNPLTAVSTFNFGRQVNTVGQAVNQVLQVSGYAMVPVNQLPLVAQETLIKPLPITQRALGPISVSDAVTVLMGSNVFTLMIDPVNRLVSVSVKPEFMQHPSKQ